MSSDPLYYNLNSGSTLALNKQCQRTYSVTCEAMYNTFEEALQQPNQREVSSAMNVPLRKLAIIATLQH